MSFPSNVVKAKSIPMELYQCVLDLTNRDVRERALFKLAAKREEFPELAPILWHSFGTIAALLQEIVSIYPLISTPKLTHSVSNRCCNALALLQCVASHQDTRSLFLNSHLGLFLYPFLNTRCQEQQYEYLRLTSLGVIGALVKMDDSEVISFLLNTEIIPLCLSIMGAGSELSQTVATFIIQKILIDDMGLNYICHTYERFDTVSTVLSKMVKECPTPRLLKHIIRCYLRLSDNQRACDALRHKLPEQLKDSTFAEELKDDPHTSHWLSKLLYQVLEPVGPQLQHGNNQPPQNQINNSHQQHSLPPQHANNLHGIPGGVHQMGHQMGPGPTNAHGQHLQHSNAHQQHAHHSHLSSAQAHAHARSLHAHSQHSHLQHPQHNQRPHQLYMQ
jgi:CCR4-NOT transcription complex subunit 9